MKTKTDFPVCLLLIAYLLFGTALTSPLNVERDQNSSSVSTASYTGTTWVISMVTVTASYAAVTSSVSLPSSTGVCTEYHVIAPGNTCSQIATEHGVSVEQILAWNPWITDGCNLIVPGWALCVEQSQLNSSSSSISTSSVANLGLPSSTTPQSPNPTAATSFICAKSYTVVSGDYCFAIAKSNGITTSQILALNPWLNGTCTSLTPGWNICLSQNSTITPTTPSITPAATSSGAACTKSYTVMTGDSCYGIATANGVTTEQIISWNAFLNGSCEELLPGQNLCLSGNSSSMAMPTIVTGAKSANLSTTSS
jgi:chitinase